MSAVLLVFVLAAVLLVLAVEVRWRTTAVVAAAVCASAYFTVAADVLIGALRG